MTVGRRLIVVRHAQSEANVIGSLHCTVPGPPLTDRGRVQAAALVEALADQDVRAVWASTMLRAQQTAAPLAAARGLEVRVHDDLREANLGDLHERTDDEAHALFDDIFVGWVMGQQPELRCPGEGESGSEVAIRWLGAVEAIVADLANGAAVVVSHAAATRLSVSRLAGVDAGWALRHHLPNTGVVVLDEADGAWICRMWAGLEPVLNTAALRLGYPSFRR
ncbi:MAG TPA: histidine phosphatase family protein [Cryptosporangiaceae bacterium]|nr:histidine phosphatase family protein [Cryptosporangiaceae bacterium]